MRLTAKSEYGVLALLDLALAEKGVPLSAREISERQGIPPRFLEQLFVSLRRAGIVYAVRGAHGGFGLAREPEQITVLNIVEALEGPLETSLCESERGAVCGRSGCCAASDVWSRATDALRSVFGSTTLAQLADSQTSLEQSMPTVRAS
jgi:Rrf2 family protein